MWLLAVILFLYILTQNWVCVLLYLLIFTPELMLLWVIIEYIRQLISSDR